MVETTSKTPAPKKAAVNPAKSSTIDAKADATKAVTKKAAPVTAGKAPAPRKSGESMKTLVSDEKRYRMIAEAAYFRAESCQFKSDPVRDWIEAERDIAILLGEDR